MENLSYPRMGLGYDVHCLVEGRDLVLGGIKIEYEKGLLGHSDADCLIHAIMDSMLGALALGDIGRHFPDTDETYKGIDSKILLKRVNEMIRKEGYELGNLDTVICAQEPKLSPYIEDMRQSLASVLDCNIKSISIKATTTEKMGFVGRKEGISCYSLAYLLPLT